VGEVLELWGIGLLCLDCLVACRLSLGNVDLVVGLAYELIKGKTHVELHTRHTIYHVPSIDLSIIPIVNKTFESIYAPGVGFGNS
jgi:hypothetical protein